jgi:hypothetical protein
VSAAAPAVPQVALVTGTAWSRWRLAWSLAIIGGVLGLLVGVIRFRRNEARAVIWIGTLGQMGPVVPLSEVKARAESRSRVGQGHWARLLATPDEDIRSYRVTAEVDAADSTVVAISATGPEPAPALALAQETADDLVRLTNGVQALAAKDFELQLGRAGRASLAFVRSVEPTSAAPSPTADSDTELFFERWAGEATFTAQAAQRVLLQSRRSEIIDAAYLVPNRDQRATLLAVGAVLGLLFGATLNRWW